MANTFCWPWNHEGLARLPWLDRDNDGFSRKIGPQHFNYYYITEQKGNSQHQHCGVRWVIALWIKTFGTNNSMQSLIIPCGINIICAYCSLPRTNSSGRIWSRWSDKDGEDLFFLLPSPSLTIILSQQVTFARMGRPSGCQSQSNQK